MVKFSEPIDINHKNFKEAMKLYEDSFPLNERQAIDTIKKRIKGNLYRMFIVCSKDKVVFMTLLYPLKKTDFVLLDYMVTDKDFRNKGIGTKFIKNILKKISSKYLILEVENPRYGNNKEQRERRVKFYKSLGAKEMKNMRYILPPLSGNIPTEMILMVLPNYGEGKMDSYFVKNLIIQIYKEVYGIKHPDLSYLKNIRKTILLE